MSPSCLTGAVQGRVQIVTLSIVSGREINTSLGDRKVAKVSFANLLCASNRTYVSDMAFSSRQRLIPKKTRGHHVPALKIVEIRPSKDLIPGERLFIPSPNDLEFIFQSTRE